MSYPSKSARRCFCSRRSERLTLGKIRLVDGACAFPRFGTSLISLCRERLHKGIVPFAKRLEHCVIACLGTNATRARTVLHRNGGTQTSPLESPRIVVPMLHSALLGSVRRPKRTRTQLGTHSVAKASIPLIFAHVTRTSHRALFVSWKALILLRGSAVAQA